MRNHYIPRFLLKAWSDNSRDMTIEAFCLDVPNYPSSRLVPKSIAYERNLYALTREQVAGFKKHDAETDILQRVDSAAALVHRKMLMDDLRDLNHEDRCAWVYFLMSMRQRTPEVISHLNSAAQEQIKASLDDDPHEYEAIKHADDPTTLSEYAEKAYPGIIENFGMMSFGTFISNPKIGEKILRMRWGLHRFDGQKNHLLLADRPLIFTHHIDNPELIIMLPISPNKAFIATNTDSVANIISQNRPKDVLTYFNELSLAQAQKRIFAFNKSPHQFIRNRMDKWSKQQNAS